ncbi:DNA cytosine methyltransferase [Pseudomonas nitroreducens]|uniref:DNA cytosine methyltransferase n=1 Tax=Pseudomonas nitroreducens TaxID=46680 RepID=UPI002FE0A06F
MAAYYNEHEPYVAQWLRNLIAAGHIAPGDVDERSIEDVHPDDLRPYTQCHFFAGLGGWSLALRRAGWPDDRPVWTGSCPCQPYSQAGQGLGFDDPRHLWPHFAWLIRQRRPGEVLGEQVASKDAEPWLDLVQTDLEAMEYAFGAVAFPSAGIGAPHIRDRTYWVAHANGGPRRKGGKDLRRGDSGSDAQSWAGPGGGGMPDGMADAMRSRSLPGAFAGVHREEESGGSRHGESERSGAVGGLADTCGERRQQIAGSASGNEDANGCAGRDRLEPNRHHVFTSDGEISGTRPAGPVNGMWADADWLFCRDGKWRPVEPGTFPLADGAPARVGRLRAYGNAINVEAATQFIAAYMEAV